MKLLDLFSGIGGFHKGFEEAGYEFDWVGYSEIDKYAKSVYRYNYPNAEELEDVTTIRPERDLPDNIDIISGGFPCQAFSAAGKRRGFDDTRGTLFFEIARILRYFRGVGKPIPYFVLENVKGLLNHDRGRTFATIYGILTDLGYTIECQLLNTRWVLPQNRERIYIVGHLGGRGGAKVFPIGEGETILGESGGQRKNSKISTAITTRIGSVHASNETYVKTKFETVAILPESDKPKGNWLPRERVLSTDGISRAITTSESQAPYYEVRIPEGTKKGYAVAEEGDSINLAFPNSKTRRGRVGKKEALTLDTNMQQHTMVTGVAHRTRNYAGKGAEIEERTDSVSNALTSAPKDSMVKIEKPTKYKIHDKQGGVVHTGDAICSTLPASKQYGKNYSALVESGPSIRRLTPIECERLQGFPDLWTSKGIDINGNEINISDTQRYKQLGNAVSVPIVTEVARRLK